MAKKSAREIVEKELTNVNILPSTVEPTEDSVTAHTSGASMDELRKKYLPSGSSSQAIRGSDSPSVPEASEIDVLRRKFYGANKSQSKVNAADEDADGVEMIRVEPKSTSDDSEAGPGAKTVLVSTREERIIGKQG